MQQLNPSEISEIIKQRIDSLDTSAQPRNEGTIVSITDGIIRNMASRMPCMVR